MSYLIETSLTTRTESVYTINNEDGFQKLSPYTAYSSFTTFPLSLIPAGPLIRYYLSLPLTSFLPFCKRLFLPRGKVSDEYMQFQFCDSVQATCSYLRGVLTIHSILIGVGVGTENASALAATLSFLLRDGASRIGSLLFSYLFALTLDAEIKFWRIFADVINDVGLTLELLAPLAGTDYFVIVLCIANICKALCGVAAEATRVAISAHFARENNMAEVQAKEGSQENAITLLGMGLGYLLAPYLNASPYHQYLTFGLLTLIHILANWYGVRILALRTLNRGRLRIHTLHWLPTMLNNIANLSTSNYFLQNRQRNLSSSSSVLSPSSRAISAAHHIEPLPAPFTPQQIATIEPIFPIHYYSTLQTYLYRMIPSILMSFCGGHRHSSFPLSSHGSTSIDHFDTTGTMFRTSRTPNADGLKDQYILTDYAIKDEGMCLSLGTSLSSLQSIACIDSGETSHRIGVAPVLSKYSHHRHVSNAWTKHVYVAIVNDNTAANAMDTSSSASFIWSNLADVLEILQTNVVGGPSAYPYTASPADSTTVTSPERSSNSARKRRISFADALSSQETNLLPPPSSPPHQPHHHQSPSSPSPSSLARTTASSSSSTPVNPSARRIAEAFIASRMTDTPINGFCIAGYSLSMYGNNGRGSSSPAKVSTESSPVLGVSYFNGITSSMKLAAYLTAHIASQIGGLTASLLMDVDTTPLGSALRICSTDWSRLVHTSTHPSSSPHHQPYTDTLYRSLLEQYIYQLQLGEWDTEGLQLAEEGYRISL